MSEKTIEWNLAFARDEVVAGLEKLLAEGRYVYTRTEAETETRFQVTPSQGVLELGVRPLSSRPSLFNAQAILHRTLLAMTFAGVSVQDEEAFLHRLTLAFLRVGG